MKSIFSLLLFVFSFHLFAQTTINFDTDVNWTAGSGGFTSYQTDHTYISDEWTFTGGPALRNTTALQDGVPGALGTYSWRLRDANNVTWTATLNTYGLITQFGFSARRWDNSPSPNYEVTYSINGGITFSSPIFVINNTSLDNSSAWKTFSYTLPTAVYVAQNKFVVRFQQTTSGERIMVDDFTFTRPTLPLNFESISAKAINKKVVIEWTTLNEVNTTSMEIQHNNGASLQWKSIGKVEAAGFSSGKTEYSFTHETPLKGDNLYRIKQFDQDGTFRYSDVVSAHFGNTHTGLILTPNLVHNSLKISFEEPVENGRVLIYNLDGKLVQSYLLAEGIDVLRVDVSGLTPGQYVVHYQSDNGIETVRFVKE